MVSDTPEEGEKKPSGLFCMIGNYVVDAPVIPCPKGNGDARGTFPVVLTAQVC